MTGGYAFLVEAIDRHLASLHSATWGRQHSIWNPEDRRALAQELADNLFTPVLARQGQLMIDALRVIRNGEDDGQG